MSMASQLLLVPAYRVIVIHGSQIQNGVYSFHYYAARGLIGMWMRIGYRRVYTTTQHDDWYYLTLLTDWPPALKWHWSMQHCMTDGGTNKQSSSQALHEQSRAEYNLKLLCLIISTVTLMGTRPHRPPMVPGILGIKHKTSEPHF